MRKPSWIKLKLIWLKTLSQLPESYREPLVLYYRKEKSVSEVAGALSLSLSATKQRLARGRAMLQTEVQATIEHRLRKTAPAAAFTLGVMAVISGTPKTAAAATGMAAATTAMKSAAGGAAAGSLLGLLGGFAGAFASWYNAEYQSQRTLIVRQGVVYLIGMAIFTVPFAAMQLGWRPTATLGGPRGYGIAYAIWMLTFVSLNGLWMFWTIRSHKKIQQQGENAERLPRYQKLQEQGYKVKGRRWTSAPTLLGLPLIQIAFPDLQVGMDKDTVAQQGTAKAWIAIGHFAYGRFFALGHRAIAPIAVGLQAIGLVSMGVFAVGIVSFGVISIAAFATGVVCVGAISLGASIAAGVLAVAPLAFGLKAAHGALAFSLQYAEGPVAFAPHSNDEAVRQFMASSDSDADIGSVAIFIG